MISFCTLSFSLSSWLFGSCVSHSFQISRPLHESPRTKVDPIENERKNIEESRDEVPKEKGRLWGREKRSLCGLCEHHKAPGHNSTILLLYFTSFLIPPNSATVKPHRRGVAHEKRGDASQDAPNQLLLPRALLIQPKAAFTLVIYRMTFSSDTAITLLYILRYNVQEYLFNVYTCLWCW